ncbi:mitochondrial ribosomal protein S25-domain-containing protein [Vararia minispora EC-137]|uniref:Mitochondrial ribosomal protein S25-domain-containing protein n=1 Tax=Vararia minispora EC-137 TaxID=1314806 RepID=A0ACB8QR20_9AGAM|nr:mitochondrial ribosomal protein S25-domain-containing protein [Vararia minispora EC-137]
MVSRRIPSQVHRQVGRLLYAQYLLHEPAWYQAVLQHPPLPLPSRAPPSRSKYDKDQNKNPDGRHETEPIRIHYIEDRIRKQFFKDHPFETFRPRTLVEEGRIEEEHRVRGKQWTRLRQRGRNPQPEDCVRFAVNLYEHHNVSLSNAYATAVAQFRALRSEHHLMSAFAAQEAEAYGAVFGPTPIEEIFNIETRIKEQNARRQLLLNQNERNALKHWRAVAEHAGPQGEWSKGREYVRLWREGVRPSYERSLTTPLEGPADTVVPEEEIDRMGSR